MDRENEYDNDTPLSRWAKVLVDFCTEVAKGERVEITGEVSGKPLMLAIYKRCLEKGAFPILRPSFPESSEIFYRIADDVQLSHVSPLAEMEAEHTDVSIHVLAESNTQALNHVRPDKIARVRLARKAVSRLRKEKVRWNVTSFPTNAYAQDAGMSLDEFTEFTYKAGFLNHSDALERWRNLRQRQQALIRVLQNTEMVRIENESCDLRLRVAGRRICESSGKVNMPDGEIYTGPVEDGVDGWIAFSFPGYYMGQVVENIRLEFKNGVVVNAQAEKNEAFLLKMLETDPGARRLGELGIGTNWGITEFTKNLLFDEKIGGTIHLALGDSYTETLGKNRSAIHWDIIHDLRGGGRILFDDDIFMENGRFVGKYAEIWDGAVR